MLASKFFLTSSLATNTTMPGFGPLLRLSMSCAALTRRNDLPLLAARARVPRLVVPAQQQDPLAARCAEEDPQQHAFGLGDRLGQGDADLASNLLRGPAQTKLTQSLAECLAELAFDDVETPYGQNVLKRCFER